MKSSAENPIIIVGAGIAGLTLGYHLIKAGRKVTVVEMEEQVGGLARSFRYDGFTFDIGPHRFHTDDQEVLKFIRDVLGEDSLTIRRKSGVYMFGKYFEWPLGSTSIFRLPPEVMVKSFFDLLSRRQIVDPDSFSEYTMARYGRTLYQVFFKHYTEKFIRIPCEEVHVDWALAGINRAVIDKRVKANSLFDLIKGVLLPAKVDTDFIYPKTPGIDNFCFKLKAAIESGGGKVLTGTKVTGLKVTSGVIEEAKLSNGSTVDTGKLVWSGEIHSLARMLGLPQFPLRYLSMVCYNVAAAGTPANDFQWIYFGDRKITINRTSTPYLFNPANAPAGYHGINVEITCMENDHTWQNPDSMINIVKKDLLQTKLVKRKEDLKEIWPERIRNTYPIYDLKYRTNLAEATRELSKFSNLLLLGRCGTFWYNNMDHSMKMAMDYAQHILTGKDIAGKDIYFSVGE